MAKRVKKYEDSSPIEVLRLRERLGLKKYRKTRERDEEEKRLLLRIWLRQIEEKEKKDFKLIGFRRRKIFL